MDRSAERQGDAWRDDKLSAIRDEHSGPSRNGASGEEATLARSFGDASPLGIVVTGGELLVIRYMNPAFRSLFGLEGDLVLGRPFESVLFTPHARRIAPVLRRVYRTGRALNDIEMRLQKNAEAGGEGMEGKDGACRSWRLTAWRLPEEDGSPKGLVLQVCDVPGRMGRPRQRDLIAEMREINQRLLVASLREQVLTEEAEAANEAKSAFLATMSHELRTPLTAVLGYEELISEGISGPVTEEQRRQLARIKLSAAHLLTLIDGILTLSRLDADREVARREPVDVASLLDEAVTLVAPLAARKHFELTVERDEAPVTVETDHHKARQILVNLLSNAVKFTDQGEILLSVRVEVDSAVFTVRDTGIGIPPEHIEHIFAPFWQVEQRRTRTVGGSGLGLSVSRRLARLLGGDLTVASAVGVGSEFTLRLPLHPG